MWAVTLLLKGIHHCSVGVICARSVANQCIILCFIVLLLIIFGPLFLGLWGAWVMPQKVIDAYCCWKGLNGRHKNRHHVECDSSFILGVVRVWRDWLFCLRVCLVGWKNKRINKGEEKNVRWIDSLSCLESTKVEGKKKKRDDYLFIFYLGPQF